MKWNGTVYKSNNRSGLHCWHSHFFGCLSVCLSKKGDSLFLVSAVELYNYNAGVCLAGAHWPEKKKEMIHVLIAAHRHKVPAIAHPPPPSWVESERPSRIDWTSHWNTVYIISSEGKASHQVGTGVFLGVCVASAKWSTLKSSVEFETQREEDRGFARHSVDRRILIEIIKRECLPYNLTTELPTTTAPSVDYPLQWNALAPGRSWRG